MDFCKAIDAARAENAHGVHVRAGKRYTTVAVRVEIARRHFGAISILTDIISAGELVVMKAIILSEDGRTLATGHAEERRGASPVNKTSALENAETSAIGRALAALGIHGGEFASENEVSSAIAAQKSDVRNGDNGDPQGRIIALFDGVDTEEALQKTQETAEFKSLWSSDRNMVQSYVRSTVLPTIRRGSSQNPISAG